MRLTIVGLGLIGGSVLLGARAMQKAGQGISRLVGIDANPATCRLASDWCDAVYANLAEMDSAQPFEQASEQDFDCVLIATPVRQYESIAGQCKHFVPESATITDVGSTKACLFDAFVKACGAQPPNLVGGHPIAGSEQSGFGAAAANLFEGKLVVVVPGEASAQEHITRVRQLWQALGARLVELPTIMHDQLLAYTSHLPHLLSFALVHYLGRQRDNDDMFRFAAGGFRDFTRIAASDPVMWRDVTMSNPGPIVAAITGMMDELEGLKNLIANRDAAAIHELFARAKAVRDYFSRSHHSSRQSGAPMDIVSRPCQSLEGVINIPGDKSISHRAVMLGALAEGTSQISNLLEGEDNLATVQAFRDMGVEIEGPEDGQLRIKGVGLRGLHEPAHPLYMGNSGTAMRLMCGLLAGQTFTSRLTGDDSLSQRPMQRVIAPLRQMGAQIRSENDNCAPLRIEQSTGLKGIEYQLPMASAQVKSCLLLAGLYAEGITRVSEPAPTRDHTERMLSALGVEVSRNGNVVSLTPPTRLKARNWVVPGDISSAAFFLVAGSIIPDSDILLPRVGVNPTRNGVLTILERMGADISFVREEMVGEEPVADIRVRTAPLKGVEIDAELIALAIDEFPILCIAAACAQGETRVRGAAELRVKESDRITAMVQGLQALGVQAREMEDGAVITGGPISGGEVDSHTDHRIAMAFAIAGCLADSPVRIKSCENIATSFPGFIDLANALGMRMEAVAQA